MNTQELKQQIDKVLGNSIRCLLPSYWWKKLFYNVADTIDNSKEELEKIVIDSLDEFEKTHPSIASRTFYWTSDENSEESSKNKSLAIKTSIAMSSAVISGREYYNNPFYIAVPISFDDRYPVDTKFIISHQYYFDRLNTKISFPEVYIGGECFDIEFDLYGDYGVPTTQPSTNSGASVVVDSSLSETSTNPVQNKVITSEISKITSEISKIAPAYFLYAPNEVKEYYEASTNVTGLLSPPRGFTIESGGALVEVDTIDIVSETEFCVEFSFYDKRYRKVFNKTSGELVRTDTISSAVTEIKMNGASMGTSGVVDLGTVITEHQTLKSINGESIVGSGDITISGSYITDFSVADIEAVYGRGITKSINVQNLMSAIESNKLIIIPTHIIDDGSHIGGNAVTMTKMENDGFIYLNVIVPYLDGVHKEYFIQIKITTAQLVKSGSNGSITLKELVARETLEEVEEVWATTYNQLNTKVSEIQKQFDDAIAEIQSIIAENESVVTAAWNQLNTRINALEAAKIS